MFLPQYMSPQSLWPQSFLQKQIVSVFSFVAYLRSFFSYPGLHGSYCTLLVHTSKRSQRSMRGGQRRGCLSFRTQYANIAGFQDELPVYRMAIINFFYRKLELSSGQLSYIIHLEIFILVPSQQILFTCIALCSFLLLFLAKFKYNRTVL